MPMEIPEILLEHDYYRAAQKYLHSLPLEHFMEATPQATQREITVVSLGLVRERRTDFNVFNELLVQYPLPRQRIGQVVPDNMVVIYDGPIDAVGSYDVPLQPARPFWTLEYVSKSNSRKDYQDNMKKYERELKVPYYLLFDPDKETVTLYRHNKKRYVKVAASTDGRCSIEELEIEVALLDGWVRFWYQGELLPVLAEWQSAQDERDRLLSQMTRRAATAGRRADAETTRADAETSRANAEAARANAETVRANAETVRADAEAARADAEKEARLAAEWALAELRAQRKHSKA